MYVDKRMPLSRGVSRTNVAYRQTWNNDDLWEVTIGPSSKASTSNDTTALSARTFSVKSERVNLYIASDENERENRSTYRDDENAEIASLSSAYHKLNRAVNSDCFRTRSFNSDNRNSISVLSGRERNDRTDGEKSEGIERSRTRADTTNYSSNVVVPLVELGAVCKILDFMADSDTEVSSVTNSCCNEISRTLRCLFARVRDKKPEDLLLKNSSLYKCERCGVISCPLKLDEEIKGNRTRAERDAEITTTVSDRAHNKRNNEESEIPTNHFPNLKNDVQSRIFADRSKANCRTENKDKSSGTESLPIKERTFVTSSCIESRNGVGNTSDMKADAGSDTIGIRSHFNNIIKRLFENIKAEKNERKYDVCNARNNRPDEYKSRVAMKARPDIGREEVVRKISYEPKSQIDDPLAGDWRGSRDPRSIRRPALGGMRDDIYSMANTVKYLARGRFTSPNKEDENDDGFPLKLRERRCTRLKARNATREQSSVLYTSRDDRPQRDSGFWLFDDESRRLTEVADEYRCSLISRLDSNRKIASVAASTLRRSETTERTKKTRSDCAEKDSLEDCTLLEQRKESGTTTLSSSSAENLIHEWIGSPDRKDEISDVDIPRGRRLVSSKPYLDIARHVRDEIAKERISDGAKKSTRQPRECSDVLPRLSSETRRRICRLIESLLLNSPRDLTICSEKKRSTADGGDLPRDSAPSATVALVSDNYFTTDDEITNICADDCATMTELFAPTKDKNCSLGRRDNIEKTSGQNSDRSEDSVKIFRKNTTARASSDKFGKMGLAHDSVRKIARQIIYKNVSPKNLSDNDEENIAYVSQIYWQILENSSNMDWDGFRKLVEVLHPCQRELWRDICRTIGEEADRAAVDGNTEVCIEISPVDREGSPETSGVMARTWEIVFELDMTLKDVEGFL